MLEHGKLRYVNSEVFYNISGNLYGVGKIVLTDNNLCTIQYYIILGIQHFEYNINNFDTTSLNSKICNMSGTNNLLVLTENYDVFITTNIKSGDYTQISLNDSDSVAGTRPQVISWKPKPILISSYSTDNHFNYIVTETYDIYSYTDNTLTFITNIPNIVDISNTNNYVIVATTDNNFYNFDNNNQPTLINYL